jgi:hypothetical protein
MAPTPIFFIKQAKIKPTQIPLHKVCAFELQRQNFAVFIAAAPSISMH